LDDERNHERYPQTRDHRVPFSRFSSGLVSSGNDITLVGFP